MIHDCYVQYLSDDPNDDVNTSSTKADAVIGSQISYAQRRAPDPKRRAPDPKEEHQMPATEILDV